MDNVVVASTEADSTAVEAIVQHHAQLAGALGARADAVLAAALRQDDAAAKAAAADLTAWCDKELLPHAAAEEGTIYSVARGNDKARLLVDAMLEEHRVLTKAVDDIRTAPDPVRAAALTQALRVLFDTHLWKENELILPLLAATPGVSVADLVANMHELLGDSADEHEHEHGHGHGHGGSCGCGEEDSGELPELDARQVPHAIRHATIFGALDAVRPGGGLVLVAPHDPLPLLAQLEQRAPGEFSIEYLERGPEKWRLALVRSAA